MTYEPRCILYPNSSGWIQNDDGFTSVGRKKEIKYQTSKQTNKQTGVQSVNQVVLKETDLMLSKDCLGLIGLQSGGVFKERQCANC